MDLSTKPKGHQKIVIIGNIGFTMLHFRKELIVKLVAEGHHVYCLAKDYTNEDKQSLKNWGAIGLDHNLNSKGIDPIKDIFALVELQKIIKSIGPNIVFSFFVKPVIFGSLAARLAKVPRVIGMIEGLGNAFTYYKGRQSFFSKTIKSVQVLLYKIVLPKLNLLIVLNPDDKKDLVDRFKIRVSTVVLGGIGVDLNEYSYCPPPTNKISFIFIARLLREKGIFEYVEAAKRIKELNPNIEFVVLGSVDKTNPFGMNQEQFDNVVKEQTIIYPGHVNNVPEWIARSSVFVLPSSYREGVPRSIQEAMAIGRPIITTDVPGCRETVIDGENGFLIPPFSVDVLVGKIKYFIENRNKIAEMGLRSRILAEEKFDVDKVNKKLVELILEYP